MAQKTMFPGALLGAIAIVSVAAVAAGSQLRREAPSLRDHPRLMRLAGPGFGGTTTTWAERLFERLAAGSVRNRSGGGSAAAPSFSRIVIEAVGVSRLEGRGVPGSQVLLKSDGRTIGVAKVAADGRWTVTLKKALAAGEHRISSVTAGSSRVVYGEDVRVFVPVNFKGTAVVAQNAASGSTRSRAERLAHEATEEFDRILDGPATERRPGWDFIGDRERSVSTERGAARLPEPVVEWLKWSSQTYQETVVDTFRSPDGTLAQGPDPVRDSTAQPDTVTEQAGRYGPATAVVDSVLEFLNSWFDEADEIYHREVARPLSVPAPDGGAVTVAEKDAVNDRAKEDARAFTEARRKADETWKWLQEKAAAEADTEEARRLAKEIAEREAEERAFLKREAERARDAARRRTEETERQFEERLERLREAQQAQKEREAQRRLDEARKEYEARRAAAEAKARAAAVAAKRAEDEEARRIAAAKAAAEEAAAKKRAAAKAAAEKAKAEKAEARRIAAAKAAAKAAAAKKKATEIAAAEKAAAERAKAEEAKRRAAEARRRKQQEELAAAEAAKARAKAAAAEAARKTAEAKAAERARREEEHRRASKLARADKEDGVPLEDSSFDEDVESEDAAEASTVDLPKRRPARVAASVRKAKASRKATSRKVKKKKAAKRRVSKRRSVKKKKKRTRVASWRKKRAKKSARGCRKCKRVRRVRRARYNIVRDIDAFFGVRPRHRHRSARYRVRHRANRNRAVYRRVWRPCDWFRAPSRRRRR